MTKPLTLAILLVFSIGGYASEQDLRQWSSAWNARAGETHCTLNRDFADYSHRIMARDQYDQKTVVDGFEIRFSIFIGDASTNSHFLPDTPYFWLFAKGYEEISPAQQRIRKAAVNGFNMELVENSNHRSAYYFYLNPHESRTILRRFETRQSVLLLLESENGDALEIDVPSRKGDYFDIWSQMLSACGKSIAVL